jgi:hypothetical protein
MVGTYESLQLTNVQALEDLARLVTVADILESLGGILSTNIEQDFLATPSRTSCVSAMRCTIFPMRSQLDLVVADESLFGGHHL